MVKRTELSDNQMHRMAKALADPRRYDILRQIGARNGRVVQSRARHLVSAATLSHHLKETRVGRAHRHHP